MLGREVKTPNYGSFLDLRKCKFLLGKYNEELFQLEKNLDTKVLGVAFVSVAKLLKKTFDIYLGVSDNKQ